MSTFFIGLNTYYHLGEIAVMKWDDVVEIPPWGIASIWTEVNNSIRYLIGLHKKSLGEAFQVAYGIRDKLITLFPIQDDLLNATCVKCQSPCCGTATVWLDYCDLIFIHLTGQLIPDHQLIEKQTDVCRYHSDKGCLIPRLSRPWVCTLYLCPPQMELLRGRGDVFRNKIDKIIQEIKLGRKNLEQEFINKTS